MQGAVLGWVELVALWCSVWAGPKCNQQAAGSSKAGQASGSAGLSLFRHRQDKRTCGEAALW